jgi:hypothetical protein
MKYLKLFEEMDNQTIDLDSVNKYINDKNIRNTISSIFNKLNPKYQKMILDYLSKKVDLDKVEEVSKKYNVFDKVKRLYDKGINSIYNIFFEKKNEEFILFTLVSSVLAFSIFIFFIIEIIKYNDWEDRAHLTVNIVMWSMIIGICILTDEGVEDMRENDRMIKGLYGYHDNDYKLKVDTDTNTYKLEKENIENRYKIKN